MRKVREFVSMFNNIEDDRFKVRAFYNITKEGEIKNHIIYIEFKTILNSGEEFKLLQTITVEAINFALLDKRTIFNEMVKIFFDEIGKKSRGVKMTDEEKAEENYTKVYLNGDMSLDTEEKYFAYTKGYCKGYTDGLDEGRKEGFDEGYKKATERAYERQQDLTDTYIRDGKKIEQLKKENVELKEQIEKMKCCENCRYFAGWDFTCNVIRATKYGATKDKNGEDCKNFDKWELAE